MKRNLRALCAVTVVTLTGMGFPSPHIARFSQGLTASAVSSQAISTCGVHCGTERWAVKTLSDDDASNVETTPVLKPVDWLVSQNPPDERPENNRISPIELTTFAVEASLLGFKRETDR